VRAVGCMGWVFDSTVARAFSPRVDRNLVRGLKALATVSVLD